MTRSLWRPIRLFTALLFTAALSRAAHSQNQPSGPAAVPLPGLSLVWSKNVGGLKSFAISAHGRRLALLTTEGKLALWTAQEGVPIWAAAKQSAQRVLVSDGAGIVLTYNLRSLLSGAATMRRADDGQIVWTKNYQTSIWSAAFSRNGNYAAVGDGDDNLHLYDLTHAEAETVVPLTGTPLCIRFAQNDASVLVGQWDRSGITCLDLAGKAMWRTAGAVNRKYEISGAGPHFVTYIGSSNRHELSPILYVVHSDSGKLLWAYNLDGQVRGAAAQSSDTAGLTAVSYARSDRVATGSVKEQRLAVIDRFGQMNWEKGGLFWAPSLICLTPDQTGMVVYDGNRTLYRLDSEARIVAHASLSDVLKSWSVSDDDTSLVVYTHDGQMSLLRIQ